MRSRGYPPLGAALGLQLGLMGASVILGGPSYSGYYDCNQDRPRRPPRLDGEPCGFRPTGSKRSRKRALARKRENRDG